MLYNKLNDGFTLPDVFSTYFKDNSKIAFTLAEVLITLGVIGIIAALTLPALIQKQNKKSLEVAFKKAYANFYNAYNKARINEVSLWDEENITNDYPELAKAIYKEYRQIRNIPASENSKYIQNVKTYTLTQGGRPACNQIFRNEGSVITPDGSAISVSQNCLKNWVVLDTNGIYKGPNAYGHDLFVFNITPDKGNLVPATSESELAYDENGNSLGYNNTAETKNKCSKNSVSNVNGVTCSSFALSDTCPDDPSKGYWECLP